MMSNEEQIEYWNGEAGERWAQEDAMMARLLQPVCEALLDHADLRDRRRALDIGCGGGSQSLMLAQRLGPEASVLGVDISAPMLSVAAEKPALAGDDAAALEFLQADAAEHPFEPGSFDLLFSRFGVMFFDDPVGAFRNLRSSLSENGRLVFCCWQALADNDWTRIPVQAVLPHVPPPEMPDPHAPGPFAFADPERLRGILEDAGFTDITIEPHAREMRFGEAPSLGASVRLLARIGPVGRLLMGQDEGTLEKAYTAMEEAMAPHYRDGALVLPGAIWFVTASPE
jgi:SAM-dependent methyltransferase